MTGIELIAAERKRQIEAEGWSSAHDDLHDQGQLAAAAVRYALQHVDWLSVADHEVIDELWPWASSWWKPRDPIANLVRAGALIAAEIDRLQRKEPEPHE